MKKVLSLVIVMVVLVSSLASCSIPVRQADINDIYYEMDDDLGGAFSTVFTGKFTFNLQAQEKIMGLVLQVNLETEDGKIIKTYTLDIGTVVPGNQYTYKLDISDISLSNLGAIDNYRVIVVDGYVTM